MGGEMIQTAAVGVIVLGAVGNLGARWWRAVAAARGKSDAGCGGGCGCSGKE